MDTRKELKEKYKQLKPDMGVFMLRNKQNNKCFLEVSSDIPSMFNRIRFQLNMGGHPNSALQKEWKEMGEASFVLEIIDKLDYSKDESRTDYRDDLQILKTIWIEKMKSDSTYLFY